MGSGQNAREIENANTVERRCFRVVYIGRSGHENIISCRHEITRMTLAESRPRYFGVLEGSGKIEHVIVGESSRSLRSGHVELT